MSRPGFLEEAVVMGAGTLGSADASAGGAAEAASPGGRAAAGLVVRNVRKVYRGGVVANDDLSLEVRPGEVYGLLGPNGAGKTTLVSQIIGLLAPTAGSITLGGVDLVADPGAARRLCSYLPQGQLPIDPLRARTAIEMLGRIRGGDARSVRARTQELLAALEITEWGETLGQALSGGVKRLVGFAMVTVQPGRLVILDEPTNDVDPLRRRLLWSRIRALSAAGSAVLLVTHNVMEAERSVDRLAVIDQGRMIAQGTPASLKAADRGRLRMQMVLEPGTVPPQTPAFARTQTTVGRRYLMTIEESDTMAAVDWVRGQMEAGVAEEYELGATNLEDVYVRLIGRTDAAELQEPAREEVVA